MFQSYPEMGNLLRSLKKLRMTFIFDKGFASPEDIARIDADRRCRLSEFSCRTIILISAEFLSKITTTLESPTRITDCLKTLVRRLRFKAGNRRSSWPAIPGPIDIGFTD